MSGFINEQRFPVKAILIGTGIAAAVTAVLLLVICGILTVMSAVPYSILPYLTLIAVAGGVFSGGYVCAAIAKSRGLVLGLLCGTIVFLILLVAGLGTGETIGIMTLLRFIVSAVFGIAGGIMGVNKKEKLRIK